MKYKAYTARKEWREHNKLLIEGESKNLKSILEVVGDICTINPYYVVIVSGDKEIHNNFLPLLIKKWNRSRL